MEQEKDSDFDSALALQKFTVEVGRLQHLLDSVFLGATGPQNCSERTMVFVLLVSCRDIVAETLHLLRGGFGCAAVRGVRTMYESVVTARYLHLNPNKGKDFLDTFHPQWARIMQNVPLHARDHKVHDSLASNVPKYREGKFLSNKDVDWSNTHTLKMAKDAGAVVKLHPYAFDQASGYVHPSPIYVARRVKAINVDEHIQLKDRFPSEEKMALRLVHDLALNAIDLRLKYVSTPADEALLTQCIDDFKKIWGYTPYI